MTNADIFSSTANLLHNLHGNQFASFTPGTFQPVIELCLQHSAVVLIKNFLHHEPNWKSCSCIISVQCNPKASSKTVEAPWWPLRILVLAAWSAFFSYCTTFMVSSESYSPSKGTTGLLWSSTPTNSSPFVRHHPWTNILLSWPNISLS